MSAPAEEQLPYADAPMEIVRAMGGRVPTLQQWRAISHPLAPCAVVAGAGSGKTAVMAARVVYLVLVRQGLVAADHGGALPSEILCLTFTNKAADELARRVRAATEGLDLPEGEEATVLTYHAFAASLLDEHGLLGGLEPGQALLSGAQKWQLVERLFADRELQHLEVRSLRHVIPQVLGLADQCANHLVDPEEVHRASLELAERHEVKTAVDRDMLVAALRRSELAELVAGYAERKRELRAIDYGDQIQKANELVRGHPEVIEAFRARFPVVLLDEYQDTNVAQARLLAELVGPDYPVFAVGDPDQNIYAWRGATLANVLRFADDFSKDAPAERRPLYVNFRSGSRILDVANAVIDEVPVERRAEDKVLVPDPQRADEGRVLGFVATDERSEARQIAQLIRERVAEAPGEPRWDDCVVLCRKKKLFQPIAEVLREEGIPVEIVDLGGLLAMPEVVDVVAWLRLLADPADNVSLARILLGPRWRIGYRDLAALARWSMRRNADMPLEDDPSPGDVRFALVEAVENLGDPDMVNLTDDARGRLERFLEVLAGLRGSTAAPLGDLVSEVIERSGLLRELEASTEVAAVSARRNLLNFVDHVASFSPVEGQASLSSLIEYLLAASETEDELEPAQLSDANTVKLMTIHKAKGLEWGAVFVPGLAEHSKRSASSYFPDVSRQPNPMRQPATLPFELRGDAEDLPRYEGNIRTFRDELTARGLEEERRLCYVALTRAKDLLVVSAAHWYGDLKEPHVPGRFFEEVAAHPVTEMLFRADLPEESPLVAVRQERAMTWPPPARPSDADELFPEGWHDAAVRAAADPGWVEQIVRDRSPAEVAEFQRLLEAEVERAARIQERTASETAPPLPQTLSVSSVIDYLRCPKLFFWSYVRPLPRRGGEAARLGTEIHRWIELQGRGQATLIDPEDLVDLATEERMGEPAPAAELREAFKRSRFAGVVPLYTERPFLLYLDGFVVGGRIDAIFAREDGSWEVVDYKTGRVPPEGDPLSGLQLDLYALACHEIWGKRPEELVLTYAYLGAEQEVSRPAGDPDDTRKRVLTALAEMAEGRFDPIPGPQCRWCDFLSFCKPGQAFEEAREAARRP